MEPIIETRDLTRRFGELTAVDRLNLSVAEGEIFGLVGPDGAGKTSASTSRWPRARSSGWWGRTARGRPPRCACFADWSTPPRAARGWPGTTWRATRRR